MWQEVFRIPWANIPVYGYGLMLVIGFLAAQAIAQFLAKRSGLDAEVFVNATLLAMVTGIVGARLSHVLENIGQYTDPSRSIWANLFDAVNIRSGGLTYYGGVLLAFPTLVIYAMSKKLPVRQSMDIVAPCLMIGLAFGRIGCFLNGCCYGAECSLPWAVTFPYESNAYVDEVDAGEIHPPAELLVPTEAGGRRLLTKDEIRHGIQRATSSTRLPEGVDPQAAKLAKAQHSRPVHPAQLYSAFTAFLLTALLLAYYTMPHAPGRVFALMMMLEGGGRFVLELVRVEPPVVGRLSLSMVLGMFFAAGGILLWMFFREPRTQGERQSTDASMRRALAAH